MLNVAVRKNSCYVTLCWRGIPSSRSKGVSSSLRSTWSEQLRIESHGPNYLANIVRIITRQSSNLQELMPMRIHVDLSNARRLDTRLKNPQRNRRGSLNTFGHPGVPASDGYFWRWTISFSGRTKPTDTTRTCEGLGKGRWLAPKCPTSESMIPDQPMRQVECWRRSRRVGNPNASPGRRASLQEVFSDEVADEA